MAVEPRVLHVWRASSHTARVQCDALGRWLGGGLLESEGGKLKALLKIVTRATGGGQRLKTCASSLNYAGCVLPSKSFLFFFFFSRAVMHVLLLHVVLLKNTVQGVYHYS